MADRKVGWGKDVEEITGRLGKRIRNLVAKGDEQDQRTVQSVGDPETSDVYVADGLMVNKAGAVEETARLTNRESQETEVERRFFLHLPANGIMVLGNGDYPLYIG